MLSTWVLCLPQQIKKWHDISPPEILQGRENLQRLCKSAGILRVSCTADQAVATQIPLRSQQVPSGHYKTAPMEADQEKSTDQGSEDDTMSSAFIIKCVMCKVEFDQVECRTRFCKFCRSKKNRVSREAYYREREETRRGYVI